MLSMLFKENSCNNVRSSYFAVRVINVWNSLPADSVDFPPLCHSNEQSNELILRRFYLVRRLRFFRFLDWLLLVPLRGLLIHSYIVSMHSLFWYCCFVWCVRIKWWWWWKLEFDQKGLIQNFDRHRNDNCRSLGLFADLMVHKWYLEDVYHMLV